MDKKKVFCTECRKDVDYTVKKLSMHGTVKDETYTYMGQTAHCNECGSEVFVEEINDENLKALYEQYRKKHGIVSLDTILSIPQKYAIGKRPLSLLLGWGELTFTRYCEGDVPTKQYSDIIKKLADDPVFYGRILEQNKSNLNSMASYKKSRKAVDLLCSNDGCPKTKIDCSIVYLLNQCEDITPLALQKALYYIQGFYYAFYHSYIFAEDCQAWTHGPVYKDVYNRYRDYRFEAIECTAQIDENMFSSSEKAVLESVAKHLCCYSGKVLEEFTHMEEPWLSSRGSLTALEPSDKVIPKKEIGKYFLSVKKKYNMINPNDIRAYAQTMFAQI